MIDIVKKTIEENNMLENGDSVTVGLSGGADSVTLMSVLLSLKEDYNLTLSAVHINHEIRGDEAQRDESFVVDFCKERNIPLTVFHKNIPLEAEKSGESEEECGRRIRYECFKEVSGGGKIATAHTLSDSNETMIFNMLRGSALSGLCGIPAKRDNIIRPLIACTREDIEKYCDENKLSYVTDSTNLKSDYTRNYIRREIMPMFSRVNQSYALSLSRLRGFIIEDNAYLENKAEKLLASAMENGKISVSRLAFDKENVPLIKRALVSFIKTECGISPESRHIQLVFENLNNDFTLQLNSDYYICVKDGFIFIRKKALPDCKNNDVCIPLIIGDNLFNGSVVTAEKISDKDFIKNSEFLLENAIDCDKINGQIFLRTRREGDEIFLFKRKVTKTLKKLFCEMKLLPEERNTVPVLCDSEKVLWVQGVGVSGTCRVTKETKNILYLRRK